jgi:hypothetical protein
MKSERRIEMEGARFEPVRWGKFEVRPYSSGGSLYIDVFHEGNEDSLYSLRLDRDEDTLTAYDPASDEGTTIFEEEEKVTPDIHEDGGNCFKLTPNEMCERCRRALGYRTFDELGD